MRIISGLFSLLKHSVLTSFFLNLQISSLRHRPSLQRTTSSPMDVAAPSSQSQLVNNPALGLVPALGSSAGISVSPNASSVDESSVMSVSPNPADHCLESRLNTTISEPDQDIIQDSYSSSLATSELGLDYSSLGQQWPMSMSPDYSQSPQFKRQLLTENNHQNNSGASGDSFYKTTASLKLPTFAHTMTRTP